MGPRIARRVSVDAAELQAHALLGTSSVGIRRALLLSIVLVGFSAKAAIGSEEPESGSSCPPGWEGDSPRSVITSNHCNGR